MSEQTNISILGAALVAGVAGWMVWKYLDGKLVKETTETKTETKTNTNMTNKDIPHGYRNNNPLNIRYSSNNNWLGKVVPNTDGVFEQFVEMPYGYRAAAFLLKKYINNDGRNTINLIIDKWAPAGDGNNNPDLYANSVSKTTGYGRTQNLTGTAKEIKNLLYAMAIVENGTKYALPNKTDIDLGYKLL